MRTFVLACAVTAVVGNLYADERDRARAALELEMQLLSASHKPKAVPTAGHPCLDDMVKAKALAARLKAPLVVWVGFKCDAVPEVRKALSDCVHCHTEELNGDKTPRLVVPGSDGENYRIKREDATVPHVLGTMGKIVKEAPPSVPQGGRTTGRPSTRTVALFAGPACST